MVNGPMTPVQLEIVAQRFVDVKNCIYKIIEDEIEREKLMRQLVLTGSSGRTLLTEAESGVTLQPDETPYFSYKLIRNLRTFYREAEALESNEGDSNNTEFMTMTHSIEE